MARFTVKDGTGAYAKARRSGLLSGHEHAHVNPQTGKDTNSGTATAPLKTLGRALKLAG